MNALLDKFQQMQWGKLNKVAPIILFLSILYLCWKLASLFWLVVAPPQVIQISEVELGSQQAPIPNITSFALFSEVGGGGTEENLNMTLQGVMVGNSNQLSSAVINVNAVADRYRVGDTINTTSYQLAEVYWDRVILLNNNGSRRELKFTGIENGLYQPIIPTAPSVNSVSSDNDTTQEVQPDDGSLKDVVANISSEHGYEITTTTPATLKSKLRLELGDKVLSLNGQPLKEGQTEVGLLELAKREGQVKLEVKRGDQVITIQQNFE